MPQANQRISEYVLEEKIGGGTFGEVWRAHHHVWVDQMVAVKIPTDPQYVRNLQREGVAIHGLVHPNIVRPLGFDPYAETPYLVMEYVPGTSLRPLVQQKKLSPGDAVAVMRQVLTGLGYAHKQGVVHRDIKPENILVHERAFKEGFGSEGVVKVTDFGLGKAASAVSLNSIAYSASLNTPEAKEIAGTLDYMAPEQRSGGDVSGKADLYACGVILYEMLTGERPAGTDVPSELNPAAPKYLDGVFKRSYARLDKRFNSAEEFLSALQGEPPALPNRGSVGVGVVVPPPLPQRGMGQVGTAIRTSAGSITCPQCRQIVAGDDQFCMHCGVQLVPHVKRCPKCGAYPDAADHYCIFCGETLSQKAMV